MIASTLFIGERVVEDDVFNFSTSEKSEKLFVITVFLVKIFAIPSAPLWIHQGFTGTLDEEVRTTVAHGDF